jgi:ABC-2 type transport system permease protein
MPSWMQPVTWVNPLRWYIEILRANLLEGSGLVELWPHLIALTLVGTVLFVTALLRFRRSLA